ncbi:hypothetical protein VTO73DRAFT_2416 [Trametes versicolor]
MELLRGHVFTCARRDTDVLLCSSTPLAVTLDLTLMATSSSSTGMAPLSSAGPPLAHGPSSVLVFRSPPGCSSTYGRLGIVDRAHFPAQEFTRWCTSRETSVEEAECAGVRDPKWLINRAEAFIDAGAHMTMIESEGITEDVKRSACKHAQPLHDDRVCVTPSTVFTC